MRMRMDQSCVNHSWGCTFISSFSSLYFPICKSSHLTSVKPHVFFHSCPDFTTPLCGLDKHTCACQAHIWSLYKILMQLGFHPLTLLLFFLNKKAWSNKILLTLQKLEKWRFSQAVLELILKRREKQELRFKRKPPVQHKNSIPKSTCSPDSQMAKWGD